ncbi:MAG: response regulator transcription factor [Oscillospiraceae bacterium]|nr:response regulator transcription factor [Oscillospiraceae bacterium]
MKLLLIEDDKLILTTTAKYIEKGGYSVDICDNGPDAESLISLSEYDCIVLDIILPGIDGLTILRNMRNSGDQTPVLLLTAKDTVKDRVNGLDSGADDYMVKPFSLEELMARIRALMRRQNSICKNVLTLADLTMDLTTHTVQRSEKEIKLTHKEFAILEYLLRNKNRLLTRTQIIDHVWNYDFDCSSNIIDVYIRYLREKIDDGHEKKLIYTVRGSGYIIKES